MKPPRDDERISRFTPAALTFLRQLKRHNDREWFKARSEQFDELLLHPLRACSSRRWTSAWRRVAPEIPAPLSAPSSASIDTRFSKDKSPYKTHVSCWFTHIRAGHGVGARRTGRGPGTTSISSWRLNGRRRDLDAAAPAAAAIRDRLAEQGDELQKLLKSRGLS
jgi:hypothetical protein